MVANHKCMVKLAFSDTSISRDGEVVANRISAVKLASIDKSISRDLNMMTN